MQRIFVNTAERTARAQAGVRWRELQKAVQRKGFAVGGPMDSNVTASGYGLGGGLNLLMRLKGLACDNISTLSQPLADSSRSTRGDTLIFFGL